MKTRSFLNFFKKVVLKLKFILTRPITEPKIKKNQKELLEKYYDKETENLIIFLTSGYDMVNGGILSISSIYEETRRLKEIHESQAILCTVPGEPLLLRYTKFKNQNNIYNFTDVLSYFKNLKKLIIHVPEYACGLLLNNIKANEYLILDEIKDLQINIMIQNIEVAMDYFEDIKNVKNRFNKVTGTTAHENYTNHQTRKMLDIPLHKLSTYVSPEQYNYTDYKEKKDIIIISHDEHPRKVEVLRLLHKEFPKLKIQIIENLTYDEFKTLISEAKWSLTFGEGLDGYFIEPIFSGAIGFSVSSPKFFTKDFESLETVYFNYDELIQKMPLDLKRLDNENNFNNYQQKEYKLCTKYYDHNVYLKNLKLFYEGDYTYK